MNPGNQQGRPKPIARQGASIGLLRQIGRENRTPVMFHGQYPGGWLIYWLTAMFASTVHSEIVNITWHEVTLVLCAPEARHAIAEAFIM